MLEREGEIANWRRSRLSGSMARDWPGGIKAEVGSSMGGRSGSKRIGDRCGNSAEEQRLLLTVEQRMY